MEFLEAFYRRKLKKKQKKSAMFHSEMQLNRAPSLASVGATATGGETTATGLLTRVLHLTRRRDSRPHSWHSTKLGEGSSESVEHVSGRSSVHSSAADLLSGLSSPGGVSWSLESLEPHTSGHPGSAHLGSRSSSSCLQLSSTRSSSSDLLHSKRDSAYSSCSPSLSFPEGLGVDSERSFSLESIQQTADMRSVHYRPHGLDPESRAGRVRLREQPASGVCYHGATENRLLNRHSLGPIWSTGQSSYENLKGAPAPQRRSETYTSTSQERPSSWSSLEHARSLRSLRCQQKGSWPHPSSSTPSAAKGLYMTEGQLHTVIEKSPESSPSSKPRQAQSPGPLQEPLTESPWPPSHSSGSNLGLYPTPHRDHWNGYSHTYHRAPEAERSLKDSRDQLDMFSSVACLGSLSCHSAPAPQSIKPQRLDREHPLTRQEHPLTRQEHPLTRQEHPLTRLEKALVEVQGGESPCLSVLEKVSRLEHRERATRQQGLSNSRHRTGPKQVDDKGTSHGAEDVRNLPGRSTCHTLSHGGGPQEKHRSCQDHRESQTQVFQSTSFRCTSLQCAPSVPPPPVPPKGNTYLDKRDPKQLPPPEKTRPKTLPKPHAGVFTSRPSAHMVKAPVLNLPTPAPLPAPTAATPPSASPLTRICGRKRLTWDQKKRSFSEPECMNEIGLTHTDSTALLRRAGDTSVADRRRMFEQAAQGLVGGTSVVVGGTSEQDTQFGLERKCSQRKGRSQRRPHSAVLQPDHTPADSVGLVTSSSLLSLQNCAQESHLFSGKGTLSSPLAPGGERHKSRSTVFYPGRVTAPRAPALQPPNLDAAVSLGADVHQPAPVSHSLSLCREVDSPLKKTPSEDRPERTNRSLCSLPGGAVEQAGRTLAGLISEKESLALLRVAEGPSAAEWLSPLPPAARNPTPDPLLVPVSRRERTQRSNLAASVGLPCPLSNTPHPLSDTPHPLPDTPHPLPDTPHPLSDTPHPLSDTPHPLSDTPHPLSDTPHPLSDTPHPLSDTPHPLSDTPHPLSDTPHPLSDTPHPLSDTPHPLSDTPHPLSDTPHPLSDTPHPLSNTPHPLSDTPHPLSNTPHPQSDTPHPLSDTPHPLSNTPHPLSNTPHPLSNTPHPLSNMPHPLSNTPHPLSDIPQPLSVTSNPLSNTSHPLSDTPRPGYSSSPSDGRDTAAPASGNQFEAGTANQNMGGDKWSTIGGSETKHQPLREKRPIGCEDKGSVVHGADGENDFSPPALPLKTKPSPPVLLSSCPSVPPASSPDEVVQNSLGLDYEPVPVRLQSPEEQRVQELLQRLVHSDGSLAPLMDVWGKSTVDVLLEICPNSPLFAELSQEQRGSSPQDHWSRGPTDLSSTHELISQKVELCEALRSCIESLEREKAELSAAFREHTELGARVEVWVQEQCEAVHRDKYLMFTGDLERVVNLLLSLCGRLARVERSLASLRRQEPAEGSTELWDSLVHKRSVLLRQTQDALELRDHLERRQCTVHSFLRLSLKPSQLQQYQHLVSSTPALLIAHRRLEDALQQNQEQLSLLLDTLPLEVTQARGWSRVGLTLSATPLLLLHSQAPPKWYPSSAHVVPRTSHLDCPVTVTTL